MTWNFLFSNRMLKFSKFEIKILDMALLALNLVHPNPLFTMNFAWPNARLKLIKMKNWLSIRKLGKRANIAYVSRALLKNVPKVLLSFLLKLCLCQFLFKLIRFFFQVCSIKKLDKELSVKHLKMLEGCEVLNSDLLILQPIQEETNKNL